MRPPIYALLESLKNLALYRILKEKNHKGCKTIKDIQLAVLAPVQYYQNYQLIDNNQNLRDRSNVKCFLDAVAKNFKVNIKILGLDWTEEALLDVCSQISPEPIEKNKIISVVKYREIEGLKEKNWVELIAV